MLKYILALIIFFGFTSVSVAQNPPSKARGQQVRYEKVVEARSRVSAVRRERIRNYFNRMTTRIEAMIERLQKLVNKIDEKSDHPDIDKASALLLEARNMLPNARDNMEDVLSSDDPQKEFKNVVESIKEIKEKLKEAHSLLVKIRQSL
jgi:exonuclease VII small subunit